MLPSTEPRSCMIFWYSPFVKPSPPYSFGIFMPKAPISPQVSITVLRVLAGGVDLHRVHVVAEEALHLVVEGRELRPLRARQRIGMDEVEAEVAQEQLAHEAGLRPFRLARSFRDLQGFPLDVSGEVAPIPASVK